MSCCLRCVGALLVGLAGAGCANRPWASTAPAQVTDAVTDARAAEAPPAGASFPGLADFEAQILAIRDAWEAKLAAPEALSTFEDFSSDEARTWREEARAPGFQASLASDRRLARVLAAAFERNPELAAARRTLAGTVEQYAQVTYLDTIMRQYASFLRSGASTGLGPAVPMDQVAKRFPFPGTLELKAAVVRHAVEGARARYEVVLRDVLTDVRTTYAEDVYLGAALSITDETLRFLRRLEEAARGRLSTGSSPKAHVLQVQVQIAQVGNELVTLSRSRETVRARLDALLDFPARTTWAEPQAPPLAPFPEDRAALQRLAEERQPEIRAAVARARRAATMIELAEQAAYPELSAGLWSMEGISLATGGSTKEREPFGTRPKVVPDPWFGTKDAYLREARSAARAAEDLVVAARNRTRYRLAEAYNQLDTARRLHELYANVQLAQARQAYEDAAAGYGAGRVQFLDVIDAVRQVLRFSLEEARAARDYRQAHARLRAAVGGPLQP